MSGGDKMSVESLMNAARDINIKLPRGKDKSVREVEDALEHARTVADDEGREVVAADVLKVLEQRLGVKKRKAKEVTAKEEQGAPKSAAPSVLTEVWNASKKGDRKALAAKLVDVAKSRGVKMPKEEPEARMGAFAALMGIKGEGGEFTVKDAVEALEDKYGKDPNWVDPNETAPKKQKPSKAKQCACPDNTGLADAFDELAGLKFKEGSKSGFVYKKVVTIIKEMPTPMTEAPKKGQIKGIGASSIAKISEFLSSGTMEELEEMRANAAA